MPQVDASFLSSTSRAVCYRMIDWKKGLELLNEKALKRLDFWGTSRAGTLSIAMCISRCMCAYVIQQKFHAVDSGIYVRCVRRGGTGVVGAQVHESVTSCPTDSQQ